MSESPFLNSENSFGLGSYGDIDMDRFMQLILDGSGNFIAADPSLGMDDPVERAQALQSEILGAPMDQDPLPAPPPIFSGLPAAGEVLPSRVLLRELLYAPGSGIDALPEQVTLEWGENGPLRRLRVDRDIAIPVSFSPFLAYVLEPEAPPALREDPLSGGDGDSVRISPRLIMIPSYPTVPTQSHPREGLEDSLPEAARPHLQALRHRLDCIEFLLRQHQGADHAAKCAAGVRTLVHQLTNVIDPSSRPWLERWWERVWAPLCFPPLNEASGVPALARLGIERAMERFSPQEAQLLAQDLLAGEHLLHHHLSGRLELREIRRWATSSLIPDDVAARVFSASTLHEKHLQFHCWKDALPVQAKLLEDYRSLGGYLFRPQDANDRVRSFFEFLERHGVAHRHGDFWTLDLEQWHECVVKAVLEWLAETCESTRAVPIPADRPAGAPRPLHPEVERQLGPSLPASILDILPTSIDGTPHNQGAPSRETIERNLSIISSIAASATEAGSIFERMCSRDLLIIDNPCGLADPLLDFLSECVRWSFQPGTPREFYEATVGQAGAMAPLQPESPGGKVPLHAILVRNAHLWTMADLADLLLVTYEQRRDALHPAYENSPDAFQLPVLVIEGDMRVRGAPHASKPVTELVKRIALPCEHAENRYRLGCMQYLLPALMGSSSKRWANRPGKRELCDALQKKLHDCPGSEEKYRPAPLFMAQWERARAAIAADPTRPPDVVPSLVILEHALGTPPPEPTWLPPSDRPSACHRFTSMREMCQMRDRLPLPQSIYVPHQTHWGFDEMYRLWQMTSATLVVSLPST